MTRIAALFALGVLVSSGCARSEAADARADTAPATGTGAADDSAATAAQPSIEKLLADFRTTVTVPPPDSMAGAPSIDSLLARFATALERSDTNAFRAMALNRAEFAYLYYPESPYTERPYRQDPALLWFMIQEGSNKGLTRLFNRYAGAPLGHVGYACEGRPEVHGQTRLWPNCHLRRVIAPGDTITDRLFGTIVERDGRFKILSYTNKL